MIITRTFLIIIYLIVCAIVALSLIKTRKGSALVTVSEREYFLKTFLTYFLLCLLTTPILYGIYKLFKK
jgi:hypothetical protein